MELNGSDDERLIDEVLAESLQALNEKAIKVRTILGRAYTLYSHKLERENYELVMLAIPKFPGNIEAIATGLDLDTLCDVLETYVAAARKALEHVSSSDGDDAADSAPAVDGNGEKEPGS